MHMIQRLESGTKYSGRMVCEHLAYVGLRHCRKTTLVMSFAVQHRFVALLSRTASDG